LEKTEISLSCKVLKLIKCLSFLSTKLLINIIFVNYIETQNKNYIRNL